MIVRGIKCMNDFDDFGGSLANLDFQKETDYYDK